ncbi:hypothetical protein DFJ63DRAFT_212509 [Scheffersomyces coipomensis]|uniref:uncharacterized protein n=1 Tax=Scheffersomyces coipomensis TaxID=1788519 RepID=UPI00315CBC92
MPTNIPPKILRIKRKRNQDPLQALILEDKRSSKRSKPSTPIQSPISTPIKSNSRENLNLIFTLTRTDTLGKDDWDETILQSVLSESINTKVSDTPTKDDELYSVLKMNLRHDRKRKFVIPKNQTEEDTIIPNELSDMVNSMLTVSNTNDTTRKRRTRNHKVSFNESVQVRQQITTTTTTEEPKQGDDKSNDDEASEYVYDVYQLNSAIPLTSANHPQSQIGYIRFFDDDDPNDLYQSDDDTTMPATAFSDDEDSNAEDFYQNDYPTDEDAGAFSETNSFTENPDDDDEGEEYENEQIGKSYIDNRLDDSELDGFENAGSYLPDDNYYVDEDNDDNDDEMNSNFKRNTFFASDEHDPMAIHRDKVFGKLEKMIQDMDEN